MNRTSRLVAALSLCLLVPSAARSGPPPTEQGVVLLRNGEVLCGRIIPTDEGFNIGLPCGEIRLKAADVEQRCADMAELYGRMRQAVTGGDVMGRLRLASWCLKQGMMDEAAREIEEAAAIEPANPLLPAFRRRLETARQRPTDPSTAGRAAPYVSPEELDRLARAMPPGSVETFTRRIQPILMNQCLTSGCHGPEHDSDFHLLRAPAGRPPSRRLTQRNLHAVLQLIDGKKPAESRLLQIPLAAHGTGKAAIFPDPQSAQFRQLADWVFSVAGRAGDLADPARASRIADTAEPATVRAVGFDEPAAGRPAAASMPVGGLMPSAVAPSEGAAPAEAQQRTATGAKFGAPLPAVNVPDPFDPETFNRKYAAEKPAEKP